MEPTGSVENDRVTGAEVTKVGPRDVHLANSVAVRLMFHKVSRGLGSKNRIREEFGVVLRVDRYKKASRVAADIWKCSTGVGCVEAWFHVTDVYFFGSVRVALLTVTIEPELLKQRVHRSPLFLVREGLEAWRGENHCADCS
jgi:hypothetical protein